MLWVLLVPWRRMNATCNCYPKSHPFATPEACSSSHMRLAPFLDIAAVTFGRAPAGGLGLTVVTVPNTATTTPIVQATRELVLGGPEEDIGRAVAALSAWPRGLPQAARLTLLQLPSVRSRHCGLGPMRSLLAKAESVKCDTLVINSLSGDTAEFLLGLRVWPYYVRLTLREGRSNGSSYSLQLPVSEPQGGSSGDGGPGLQHQPSSGGECIGEASPGEGNAAAAAPLLPTLEDLSVGVVEVMEARARSSEYPTVQALKGGRTQATNLAWRRLWGEGNKSSSAYGIARWWWNVGCGKGDVVLLSGPGVSGLAAHSHPEGAAALRAALAGLSRSGGGTLKHREYGVLPGGGGVLLRWDGAGADEVEAAVEAVRRAAATLGREAPEGGVRAVALPHGTLCTASKGLDACACKVRGVCVYSPRGCR